MKQNNAGRLTDNRKSWHRHVDTIYHYCAYPRLLLEVFIRRNFGKRYFSLSKALLMLVALACWPSVVKERLFIRLWHLNELDAIASMPDGLFWWRYGSWYAFLILFLSFSLWRKLEIKQTMNRSTRYAGDLHPVFDRLKLGGRRLSLWTIEVLCEPGAFMIAGFLLSKVGQRLGGLLMIASIGYSIYSIISHYLRNTEISDRRDIIIDGQELGREVMNGLNPVNIDLPQPTVPARRPADDVEDVF
ncbi:hypothetical protein KTO58_19335 [Chitinophaga pendula]|uniref:hypothetical protein n=1 Tax=Chitinophaga TaxID=79328 RepID=UPI000BAF6109|nr:MULTISPECIES: hypothetical protein [Chitinophaga]ASZ11174.1 hypothetical protein CK934_09470 [Chitinophaga sp. MD30]UCJ05829.1 hypothetical protein KTO58_19335 [Chitinophaga pendula]